MKGRFQKRRAGKTDVNQELELMPMLNVFISIIPLLLLSAAFVQLAVIPASLPGAPGAATVAAAPGDVPLAVAIVIRTDAYEVRANGSVAGTVARPAAGDRDAAPAAAARRQLGELLAGIAAGHPGTTTVRIEAGGAARYEDIIDVMDVSRSAGLPDAALADAAQGAS